MYLSLISHQKLKGMSDWYYKTMCKTGSGASLCIAKRDDFAWGELTSMRHDLLDLTILLGHARPDSESSVFSLVFGIGLQTSPSAFDL